MRRLDLRIVELPTGLHVELADPEETDHRWRSRAALAPTPAGTTASGEPADLLISRFRRGALTDEDDARTLGRWLFDRLIVDAELVGPWSERQGELPLQLRLLLDNVGRFAELPFELLTSNSRPDASFLFRQYRSQLVRQFADLGHAQRSALAAGAKALVVTANPFDDLPTGSLHRQVALFEEALSGHAQVVRGPANPSRTSLNHLEGPFDILFFIGHGREDGQALIVHADPDDDDSADLTTEGVPYECWSKDDIACFCKKHGIQLVFLWSCFSGTPAGSSLARAILDPVGGNAAVVIAAQGVLQVSAIEKMTRGLLESWLGVAGGSLDEALAEARRELQSHEWQWAMPVLYRRPYKKVAPAEVDFELSPRPQLSGGTRRFATAPLPQEPEGYVARDDLDRELDDAINAHRLVVVTGNPGIGKTELAAAALRRAKTGDRWDGVEWRPVAGRTVRYLVDALRRLVSVEASEPVDFRVAIAAIVNAIADAPLLLVIDNSEDLLAPGAAEEFLVLISSLLDGCPNLHLVLTSTTSVPQAGRHLAHRVEVRPLETSVVEYLMRRLSPKVDRLGVADRAELVGTAAGNVRAATLLARIVEQSSDPVGAARDLVAGQRVPRTSAIESADTSLDYAIGRQYERLETQLPRAARLLAIGTQFPAGLPLSVLRHALPNLAAVLDEFREFHLDDPVRRDRLVIPPPIRAWWNRNPRLTLLEEEWDGMLRAHADYADWLYAQLGGSEGRWAQAGLHSEERNVDVLAGRAATTHDLEAAVRFTCVWLRVTTHLDQLQQAESLAQVARGMVEADGSMLPPPAGRASLLQALGDLFVRTDRLDDALATYQNALQIYTEIHDRLGEAHTQRALGDLFVRTDRLDDALATYQHALPIYVEIHNRLGEANTRRALGSLFVRTARLDEALAAYQHALRICVEIHDRLGEANTRHALGELFVRTDRLDEALAAYQHALQIYFEIHNRLGEANTRQALGELFVRTDRLDEALAAYQHALPIYVEIHARLGEAHTRQALGDLFARTDQLDEALAAYQHALPIYVEIHARLGEANTRQALGDLFTRTDRLDEALAAYQHALPIYVEIHARLGEANTRRAVGGLLVRTARFDEALAAYQRALQIYAEIHDRLGEANTRLALGELFVRTDRLDDALATYQHALQIYAEIHDRLGEAHTRRALGELFVRTDRLDDALAAYQHALQIYVEVHYRLGEAHTRRALGDLFVRTTRLDEALAAYQHALQIYVEVHARLGEANTQRSLGALHSLRGDSLSVGARSLLSAALIHQEVQDLFGLAGDLGEFSRHLARHGEWFGSAAAAEVSARLLYQIRDRWGFGLCMKQLSLVGIERRDGVGLVLTARSLALECADVIRDAEVGWEAIAATMPAALRESIECLDSKSLNETRHAWVAQVSEPWLVLHGGDSTSLDDPSAFLALLSRYVQRIEAQGGAADDSIEGCP